MLCGYGMHACFGAHINRAVLPAMLKPLLAQPNLRRADRSDIAAGTSADHQNVIIEIGHGIFPLPVMPTKAGIPLFSSKNKGAPR